jgi:predicted ATPase
MRSAVERHGGTVEKFVGDAVMAVYGLPALHEDDALRAARAALEMRETLMGFNREIVQEFGVTLVTRVGVNTGEVVAGTGASTETLVTGDAVNVAARLQQSARAGEILLGEQTWRLIRNQVMTGPPRRIRAKGKSSLLLAHPLHSIQTPPVGPRVGGGRPLVGRERELRSLRDALEEACRDRSCVLVTDLGAAGVGKSRLVHALAEGVGESARVLSGRCLPYGQGITYWPLREVLHDAAGIAEGDSAAVARSKLDAVLPRSPDTARVGTVLALAIGLAEGTAAPVEVFWATRSVLRWWASRMPQVIVLEDIHWAEPTLLDLIAHLAQAGADTPTLVVATARLELLEARPDWSAVKGRSLVLEPLLDEDAELLLELLPGGSAIRGQLRAAITSTAEGNPLFVEELLALLRDEGVLFRRQGRWRIDETRAVLTVPPTVSAVLAARVHSLPSDERAVAQRGSVVGRVFQVAAVEGMTQGPARGRVVDALGALTVKELIGPMDPGAASSDVSFRFRHLLVRDAFYDALSKTERALLHERFATWLEGMAGDRLSEYEEIVGYHLEQAHGYLQSVAGTDPATGELAQRAGERLAAAGQGAWDRSDMPAAANLLSRACALLPDTALRARTRLRLGQALRYSGTAQEADAAFARALREAEALGDACLEARIRVHRVLA